MTDAFDPYQVLGVQRTATAEEITTAYRSLAQAEHPDKGGDTARMQDINRAFALLSDSVLRGDYDQSRAALAAAADPRLSRIREAIVRKSPVEIVKMRREIAEQVHAIEPHFQGTPTGGIVSELALRFGQAHADREAARLERHRAELVFLDRVLESIDPILAAQAKGDELESIKRLTAGKNVHELRLMVVDVSRAGRPAEIAYLEGLIASRAGELAA